MPFPGLMALTSHQLNYSNPPRPKSLVKRLTVAAGYPVHDEPPDVEHAGVVVDVEEGDLVVVLPQYEEEGVHELDELGEVVPPQDVDDLIKQTNKQKLE